MSDIGKVLGWRAVLFAWLARIVLWSEAITAAFWPPLTLIGLFIALALFSLPQSLPGFLHVILLLAFAGGLFVTIRDGVRRFKAPTVNSASRRVEKDSGLAHRPFATLLDAPAADASAAGRALWQIHVDRRRTDIKRLALGGPRPDLPTRDPRALRLGVFVLLVLGIAIAGGRSGDLILAAFEPHFSSGGRAIPLDAWIKPPAYTGLAPILLNPEDDRTVAVPTGSTIEAHVTDGSRLPKLVLGDERQDFRKVEGGGYALSYVLKNPGKLKIEQGWLSALASWHITIIPDHPPAVGFTTPPSATRTSGIKIDYEARDDYGVVGIDFHARIVPSNKKIVAEPIDVKLVSEQNEKELKGSSTQDLTAHPWAGMKVLARLVATDGAEQTGVGDEIVITLPEKIFNKPVAKSLIAARKQIILNAAPWRHIAANLASIAYQPDLYGGDTTIFLALKTAAERLNYGKQDDDQTVVDVEDLLWNSAIHLEEGDKPDAEKALKESEDALDKALKDPNSSGKDISKLSKDLQASMDRFLDAMQKQQQKNAQQNDPQSQKVDRKDLKNQVDKLNQMAQAGARQSAEEMLNNLKSMLDNMQAGNDSQSQSAQGQESQQALDELKSLAQQQRDLMGDKKKDPASQAKDQEALRKALGDAMRDLDKATGEIPKTLSGADRAMKDATKSLEQGQGDSAREQQADAAGQLDQAVQGLSGQLSNQGEDGQAFRDGEHGRDPFGRGNPDSQGVKVPTEREMSRAIEILDELRRRAGEHERPRLELDYIQRLLQQF